MANNGLWIDNSTFRKFASESMDPRSLSGEIATRDRSIDFYMLGMYLPNPDPVLKKMGKDIKVYTELASDAHVGGCITSRKAGVKKLLWDVDRGKAKSRQAKFVSDAIKALNIKRLIGEILNAVLYGYQPLEIMWNNGISVVPNDVVGKPQSWFVYDDQNEPRFLTKLNPSEGIPLPPNKFIFARHEPTYENPYGFAELSRCFWPATFKKGGYKFWVKFVEKYGMPWPIGKLPRGLDQSEYDDLYDVLDRMVQDGVAVIPDDGSVSLLEATKGTTGSIHRELIQECKTDISIALLGHAGSAQSTPGRLGGEDQAGEIRSDRVGDDKGIVEETMNTLIKYIALYNFSERVELPTFILYEEEDVDKVLADRDAILTQTGIKFKPSYYVKAYGLEEKDFEVVDVPASVPPGQGNTFQFASGSGLAPVILKSSPVDSILARMKTAAPMDGLRDTVNKLLAEATTLEEFRDKLIDLYPEMDVIQMGNVMQQAMMVAELAGRNDVTPPGLPLPQGEGEKNR